MLCDDIVAEKKLPMQYPGFDKVQKLIANAQKFALEQDFSLAADGLVENRVELTRAAPFCRLPYPLTWFEFAQSHRTHWVEAPMHYPDIQSRPVRVGFLCQAHDDKLLKWSTTLCWSLGQVPDKAATLIGTLGLTAMSRINASVVGVDYDMSKTVKSLDEYVQIKVQDFIPNVPIPEDAARSFMEIMISDWSGEIRYLVAILGLLNARNVADETVTNYVKLNRARQRSGKLPMFEHRILRIRPLHKRALVPGLYGAARSAEIRSHYVRGHFKQRKTGLFFWGPHVRGKKGFVSKTYVIGA